MGSDIASHRSTDPTATRSRLNAWLVAAGAVLAAGSVALAAYASHGVDGDAQARLQLAAVLAFGHGLALAALAPRASTRLAGLAMAAMLVGVLLFSGSLVAAHFHGGATTLAPLGGSLMILAWLVHAIDAVRR